MFWYWTLLGTLFAAYTGFCAVLWWYTRSKLSALLTVLSFWLFLIASSVGLLDSGVYVVHRDALLFVVRFSWIPVAILYWMIVDRFLGLENGDSRAFRTWWRLFRWRVSE